MNTKTMKKDFSSIGIRMLISTAVITLLQLVAQTFALTLFPEWQNNFNILLAVTMVPLYVLGFPISFALMRNKDMPAIEKHHMSAGQLFRLCLREDRQPEIYDPAAYGNKLLWKRSGRHPTAA